MVPKWPDKAVYGVESAIVEKSIDVQESVLKTCKKALAVRFLSGREGGTVTPALNALGCIFQNW